MSKPIWNIARIRENFDSHEDLEEHLTRRLNELEHEGCTIFQIHTESNHNGIYGYNIVYKSKQALIKQMINE